MHADAELESGPDKSDARLLEKAKLSYQNDLTRVTDYKRKGFVCDGFAQMTKLLQGINREFEVLRIKDRFAEKEAKNTGG